MFFHQIFHLRLLSVAEFPRWRALATSARGEKFHVEKG